MNPSEDEPRRQRRWRINWVNLAVAAIILFIVVAAVWPPLRPVLYILAMPVLLPAVIKFLLWPILGLLEMGRRF